MYYLRNYISEYAYTNAGWDYYGKPRLTRDKYLLINTIVTKRQKMIDRYLFHEVRMGNLDFASRIALLDKKKRKKSHNMIEIWYELYICDTIAFKTGIMLNHSKSGWNVSRIYNNYNDQYFHYKKSDIETSCILL